MCVPYSFAPAHVNKQRAGAVAALGEIYFVQEKCWERRNISPSISGFSQAEREREEKLKQEEKTV